MNYNELSDFELAVRLKSDDMDAFNCIYRRYMPELYGYLNENVYGVEIIIDVFISLWFDRQNGSWGFEESLLCWIKHLLVLHAHDRP